MSGPSAAHSTTAGVISYAGSAAAAVSAMNVNVATMKIHPRGLINSSNMCFANSVLQIMVYCLPFHWLFAKLGRVLGMGGLSGVGGKTEGTVVEESAYPLIEATVEEVLREFVVDDKLKESKEERPGKCDCQWESSLNISISISISIRVIK